MPQTPRTVKQLRAALTQLGLSTNGLKADLVARFEDAAASPQAKPSKPRGPRFILRQKHFIDVHKGATAVFALLCVARFNQWENPTAMIYVATHGVYGVLWMAKSCAFGDRSWEAPCTAFYGVYIWSGLTLWWITPFLICRHAVHAPAWLLAAGVASFGFGVFLHFASDMQKHMSLTLAPGRLITTGLWSHTRNPNYLGELLIYAGFSSLAAEWAWVPACVLAAFLVIIWGPNMRRKDKSLSRYPEFAEYKRRSGLIIPCIC
jgi:protein-S-isoprenylcysteine O-methyltransferase Ste14